MIGEYFLHTFRIKILKVLFLLLFTTVFSSAVLAISSSDIEQGVITGVSSSTWKTVNLNNNYSSMVVVATPNYSDSSNPGVVRIRNAGGSSFQVKMSNASSGSVSNITVYYLVVEEGVYNSPKMEARKVISDDTNRKNSWDSSRMEAFSYSNMYTNPVVLGQVMTHNDADFSIFWASDGNSGNPPGASACYVGKHIAEDTDTVRFSETLGVIVLESGSGTIAGMNYIAGRGSDIVEGVHNAPPYSYSLSGIVNPDGVVLSSAGMDGGDGGWPVLCGNFPVTSERINTAIDEDTFSDTERGHTTEQLAFLVLDDPSVTSPEPAFTLTVINGAGDGSFFTNENVNISADPAPAGQEFDSWVVTAGSAGFADDYSSGTTLTMGPANVTVKAIYRPVNGDEWQLVFSDEFDYSGKPDGAKWNYDIGTGIREDGWGSWEKQYYTDRVENASVDNGYLSITARKEAYGGINPDTGADNSREYTSARLVTRDRAVLSHGRYEFRAKLPRGKGTWPAIWMLGTSYDGYNWADCGEIDIMEHVGKSPNGVLSGIHCKVNNFQVGTAKNHTQSVPTAEDTFHVYVMDWSSEKIDIYIDGTKHFTYLNDGKGMGTWPFDQPFNLIMNLTIGGGWGGQVDDTIFPQSMLVDYVRVYKKKSELENQAIPDGEVFLKAVSNAKFVTADLNSDGKLFNTTEKIDGWERFKIIKNADNTVSLLSQANGWYVSADIYGDRSLAANRTVIDGWEKFRYIHNPDGTISLQSIANNKYVCAPNDGTNILVADRDAIDVWEKFIVKEYTSQIYGGEVQLVTPVDVTASSSYGTSPAERLIDGSGLSENSLYGTHDNDVLAQTMWMSGGGTVEEEYLIFDLGANYDLSRAYIWQMNQGHSVNAGGDRGVASMIFYVSSDGTNYKQIGGTQWIGLTDGSSNGTTPFTRSLYARNVRYVKFDIRTSGGDNYVGLSEVRFGSSGVTFQENTAAFTGKVSLQAVSNNKYIANDLNIGSTLINNRDGVDGWEIFEIIINPDKTCSLLSWANGKYVSADLNQGGVVIGDRSSIGMWEKFNIIKNADGTCSFQAVANNNFISARAGGLDVLSANQSTIGSSEKFIVEEIVE